MGKTEKIAKFLNSGGLSVFEKPQPSWMNDTLEGHIGAALQMQESLREGVYRQEQARGVRTRLFMCLSDLAERLHSQGLTAVETMRGRADVIVMKVSGNVYAEVERIEDYRKSVAEALGRGE